MKMTLMAALVAVFALAGCDTTRDNVREAQQEVQKTQQEVQKDVSEAQGEAVKDVNEAKKEAASDIQESQRNLQEAQRERARDLGTASGTTTDVDGGTMRVTHEQCQQFAINKTVTPENRVLYEACSKLDPEKYR
ncbi:MAG: hypothetical protein NDI61_09675 [Bdellovibrionaceae bacterium]|nr:hypothetical protein [Pseudobdellovibrionaceae bacterium]